MQEINKEKKDLNLFKYNKSSKIRDYSIFADNPLNPFCFEKKFSLMINHNI